MNFKILSSVVDELSLLLPGARVERVYEGPGGGFYVMLRRDRKNYVLQLSPVRPMPRLHLVSQKPPAAASPCAFILYLKSRLAGAKLVNILLLNEDRVAEIRFSTRGGDHRLVFELTGSAANLILIDAASTILAVYHPVLPEEHAARPLVPGVQYVPPEKKPSRASSSSSLDMGDRGPRGQAVASAGAASASANEEAERYYDGIMQRRNVEALRVQLRSLIKKTLERTKRRIDALSADLSAARKAEEYKRAGDCILANLSQLESGAAQVELMGHDGKTVILSLDPKRSPSRNAELYFKKYKKAKAGLNIIPARLQHAMDENAFLESRLAQVEQAEDGTVLARIRSELAAKGYLQEEGARKGIVTPGPAQTSFRKILYRGWEILVGKSAAGNDYLTTKMARANDLWLHAEGMPGSHVLVRNPEAREIPPGVLAKAASLAAFYSRGRVAGKVAVTYTPARFVKKPKGAKPGLVTLLTRKTLMAVPEES